MGFSPGKHEKASEEIMKVVKRKVGQRNHWQRRVAPTSVSVPTAADAPAPKKELSIKMSAASRWESVVVSQMENLQVRATVSKISKFLRKKKLYKNAEEGSLSSGLKFPKY